MERDGEKGKQVEERMAKVEDGSRWKGNGRTERKVRGRAAKKGWERDGGRMGS